MGRLLFCIYWDIRNDVVNSYCQIDIFRVAFQGVITPWIFEVAFQIFSE